MEIHFTPMTAAEAAVIDQWRWPGWSFDRPSLHSTENCHTARNEDGDIVGYCTFGSVPEELDPQQYAVVTGGLDPDLRSQGHGSALMAAILELGRREFPDKTIAGFIKDSNNPSLRSALPAGFVVLRRNQHDDGVILVDPAGAGTP